MATSRPLSKGEGVLVEFERFFNLIFGAALGVIVANAFTGDIAVSPWRITYLLPTLVVVFASVSGAAREVVNRGLRGLLSVSFYLIPSVCVWIAMLIWAYPGDPDLLVATTTAWVICYMGVSIFGFLENRKFGH